MHASFFSSPLFLFVCLFPTWQRDFTCFFLSFELPDVFSLSLSLFPFFSHSTRPFIPPFPLRRRYSCSPTSLPRVPTLVTFASIPFDALFKEIILHKSAAFLNWRTLMAIKIVQQVFRNERHTFVVGNCLNQRMINRREKQANYRSMLD